MKKEILSVLLLWSGIAIAQQALNDRPAVRSAIVHEDRSVAIQLYAPEAKEVRLEGELTEEGSVLMTQEANGVWCYRTKPLAPDLYLYYMMVDGVRTLDPGNSYVARDISSLFNYVLADAYESRDIAHGQVVSAWCPQSGFQNGRRMHIYLPASYTAHPERRYPVLYLLHGSGGDENAWLELGRTAQIMDEQIALGRCAEMIVVMPNGNISEDATPGYGSKGNVSPGIPSEHRMDGLYEGLFCEIIDYIDSHYRTYTDAAHRAIAGLSMGGYHCYWIALNYPERFGYAAPFSAVYHHGDMQALIYEQEEEKQARFWAHHPLVHLYIGKDDFLYEQNKAMRAALDSKGYSYRYTESTGGHQWKNWRHYLQDWVTELFREEEETEMRMMVRRLHSRYPAATLQDVYKTCYQDYWGAEHMAPDSASAAQYLHYELTQVNSDSMKMPQTEACGWQGRYERVSLASVLQGEMTEEALLSDFLAACRQRDKKSKKEWQKQWQKIAAIALEEVSEWQNPEQEKSLRHAAHKGAAVRHSEAFRETYQPHYRIRRSLNEFTR